MLFSELYKIIVKKVTFVGLRGGAITLITPLLDPPLETIYSRVGELIVFAITGRMNCVLSLAGRKIR